MEENGKYRHHVFGGGGGFPSQEILCGLKTKLATDSVFKLTLTKFCYWLSVMPAWKKLDILRHMTVAQFHFSFFPPTPWLLEVCHKGWWFNSPCFIGGVVPCFCRRIDCGSCYAACFCHVLLCGVWKTT